MTYRYLIDSSIFCCVLSGFIRRYRGIETIAERFYCGSYLSAFFRNAGAKISRSFENSALGRLTGIKPDKGLPAIAHNNIYGLIISFGAWMKSSIAERAVKSGVRHLSCGTSRAAGIIILSAVLSHIIFASVFGKSIGPYALFLHAISAFIAIAMITVEVDWQHMRDASLFMKLLRGKR